MLCWLPCWGFAFILPLHLTAHRHFDLIAEPWLMGAIFFSWCCAGVHAGTPRSMPRCATPAATLSTHLVCCCSIACPWLSITQLVAAAQLHVLSSQTPSWFAAASFHDLNSRTNCRFAAASLHVPSSRAKALWVLHQAMARVWRDGQQHPCTIYRLLTTGARMPGPARHLRSLLRRKVWPM